MNNKIKSILIIVCIGIVSSIYISCQQLGLAKEKTDNTPLTAGALLLSRSSSSASSICSGGSSTGSTITNSTATLDVGTGCVTGVATSMDSALPDWIKNNFKCSVAYVSGSYLCFKSKNLPNTKSAYYGASSPLYEAITIVGNTANPNSISSQNLVYAIPLTATKGTGTDSTQGGLVSIGITVNGLAVFNNAAAPPDTLSVEAQSFDDYAGHPQNSGVYHHHAAVPKVCNDTKQVSNSTDCGNSALIGIALDGYAIYGSKCDNGTASTLDDTTPTLDSLHGHTAVTTHFTTATYHYHYANDATATIYTLMGSYFYGNKGSVSN